MVPEINLRVFGWYYLTLSRMNSNIQCVFLLFLAFKHFSMCLFDMNTMTAMLSFISIVWSLQNEAVCLYIPKHGEKDWLKWWYSFPDFQMTKFSSVTNTHALTVSLKQIPAFSQRTSPFHPVCAPGSSELVIGLQQALCLIPRKKETFARTHTCLPDFQIHGRCKSA